MESNITILKYYLSIWLVIVKKKKKKKQKKKKVERTEREAPRQSWVSHIIYFFSLNFPIEVELRCTERSRIRWILVALVAQPSPTRGFSLSCLPLFITLRVFFCFCFFFPPMVYSQRVEVERCTRISLKVPRVMSSYSQLRVYLGYTYFVEIENFLLKAR